MELKDFISETLINIVEGINSANSKTKFSRFVLDDVQTSGINGVRGGKIDFDVSLIVNESRSKESKNMIGVLVGYIGAGKKNKSTNTDSNENSHRIKFKVIIEHKR